MNWLFVAVLGGNLMTAPFDKEAECLGQKDITLRDHHVSGQCVDLRTTSGLIGGGTFTGTIISPTITIPNGGSFQSW